MKKYVLFALMLLAVAAANAADLVTDSGQKYENAEIRKIAAGCVQIRHQTGEATIALEDLPENFIAALSIRQRYSLQSLVDIKLPDGKVYYKTTIKSLGSGFVFITHLHGDDKIPFKDLPRKYLATFTRRQLEAVNKVPDKKKLNAAPTAAATAATAAAPVQAAGVEKTKDGKPILTGPRGGKYYINDAGKKVYLRKR